MLKIIIRGAPVFTVLLLFSCGAPKQQLPKYNISFSSVSDFYDKQIKKQVGFFKEYIKLCSPSFNSTKAVEKLPEKEKNFELKKYFICCKYLKHHLEIISSVMENQTRVQPKGGVKNATKSKR